MKEAASERTLDGGLAGGAIVDAHAHFFSHGFFRALIGEAGGGQAPSDAEVAARIAALGLEAPPSDDRALARRWVEELDRHGGVGRMALIASVPGDWPAVAAAIRAFPARFFGFTMVIPRAEGAAALAERALAEGGLRGLCLFPAMHRFRVFDPEAAAILEVARRHHAVVFCHFGLLEIPIRARLGLASRFDGTCANPTDLHRAAVDFPELTFQVPHFGAGYLRETLLLGKQCRNVVIDTSSSNGWMRLAAPALELREVFRAALEAFGPERILFGSDSSALPRGWRRDILESQLSACAALGLDRPAIEAIFGGNARRVYRLE
jgi:hypothetical protein